MRPDQVHQILCAIGATHVYHANTVATSCTFLEQGGLLSRGFVESKGLVQTPQNSDDVDRRYGIWDCVFMDHVDIHDRAGRRKGPNHYGPVLFQFDRDILLDLPRDAIVEVTKTNPVHWPGTRSDNDRFFQSSEELAGNIGFGDFDKMLVLRAPKVPFARQPLRIIVDDPEKPIAASANAYEHAVRRLTAAAAVGGIEIEIQRRACRLGCICVAKYRGMPITQKFN